MAQPDAGAIGIIESPSITKFPQPPAPKTFEAHVPLLAAPRATDPFAARHDPTPIGAMKDATVGGSEAPRSHAAPIRVATGPKTAPSTKAVESAPKLAAALKEPSFKTVAPPKTTKPKKVKL